MFPCPICGASSRTRTSRMENKERTIRRTYYQCNNPECGVSFYTLQSVIGLVGKNKTEDKSIPWEDFPSSHRGRNQLNFDLDQKDETQTNRNHP
ncbi:ogr/Delta-like zinc finger family protein [Salmonella enterica]|nr:ogr/Delta-like zinc finger family protein [Salmonella enterica]EIB1513005.1 ogr/Delta-like zinc finger family protein [Salmonella enterica]